MKRETKEKNTFIQGSRGTSRTRGVRGDRGTRRSSPGRTHTPSSRAAIHPFVDGNGRVARALATLILFLREFDIKRFFALDDYYDSDRNAY